MEHYLEFRYSRDATTLVEPNNPLLARNVVHAVHCHNLGVASGTERLAVALPGLAHVTWRKDGRPADLAACLGHVRVFGSQDALAAFAERAEVDRLVQAGMIRTPRVREVEPEAVLGYAVYRRERRHEATTDAAILRTEARYQRRAEARGETRDSIAMIRKRRCDAGALARSKRREAPPVYLAMQSGSTGQRFSLSIARREVAAPDNASAVPDVYGLARVGDGSSGARSPVVVPEFDPRGPGVR